MQSSSNYSVNGNSGYQPPTLHHRAMEMGGPSAMRTGRIIDRADKLFQRSKGRWKYVCAPCILIQGMLLGFLCVQLMLMLVCLVLLIYSAAFGVKRCRSTGSCTCKIRFTRL
jgi:hypothetical protein